MSTTPLKVHTSQAPVSPQGKRLYREEVYNKHGASQFGSALDLRIPHLGLVALFSILVINLIGYTLAEGEYSRKEVVSGIASNGLGPIKVYSPVIGTVVKQYAMEGAVVTKGDSLFVISTDKSTVTQRSAFDYIRGELSTRRQTLVADIKRRSVIVDIEQRNALQASATLTGQIEQINREIELAKSRVALSVANVERYRQLAVERYVVDSFLLDKEQELRNYQIQIESLSRQREGIRRDLDSAQNSLASLEQKGMIEQADLQRSIADLNQQLADFDSRKETLVVAHASGTLVGRTAEVGSVVSSGSHLVSILPAGPIAEVQLFVPSRSVGFVRVGTQVNVRFDAFPYQKFGQATATVSQIGAAPMLKSEIPFTLAAGGEDYFRIFAALDRSSVKAYGEDLPIQNGMRFEADMILEKRKVYEWIIEPVLGFTKKY
jgi:membrane fusion protein